MCSNVRYFTKMLGVRILLRRDHFELSRCVKTSRIRGYSSLPSDNSARSSTSYQSVADFYAGKSVFITGATGFLGKVFIEKLLYSCTKLDKIYLLVRDKNGDDINKRIENMFGNPLFSRLKASNPQCMEKVVPITGDITLPNLGLKPEDEQTLINKVSVVFHAAAIIKFNEPLPIAMNINLEGTQKMLELSRRIKNIEAFVYISTAFAHTQKPVLAETVYPPPAKLDDVYKFIDEYGSDMQATAKFIKNKPNTYTFTKALAESYIANNHGEVPTIIVRPSIVSPIKDEPIKGWLDNWFGATHNLYNTGNGWNCLMLGDGSNLIDLIPVDYVSNLSIVAAAKANKSKETQVFNCTSSSENPISWGDSFKYFKQETVSRGQNDGPYQFMFYTKSKTVLNIGTVILQMTPAYVADLWLKMTGRQPKYFNAISQIVAVRNVYNFFTLNSWVMKSERARELSDSLSPEDKEQFPCDPTQIEWSEYLRDYCKGVYRFLKPKF